MLMDWNKKLQKVVIVAVAAAVVVVVVVVVDAVVVDTVGHKNTILLTPMLFTGSLFIRRLILVGVEDRENGRRHTHIPSFSLSFSRSHTLTHIHKESFPHSQ